MSEKIKHYYEVVYSEDIQKQLKKMDKHEAKLIISYMDNLETLENPKSKGKPLEENLAGLWRYRIKDYRVICEFIDNKLTILALYIGHRKQIYKNPKNILNVQKKIKKID